MTSLRTAAVIVVTTLATILAVLWLRSPVFPLGVEGEWVWSRIRWGDAHAFAWMTGLFLAVVTGVVVAVAASWLSAEVGVSTSAFRRTMSSTVVMLMTMAWWFGLLSTLPSPFGLARNPFVLFYPRMTGYYAAARFNEATATQFLATYEATLRNLQGTERYLHIGTHPPGMILLNRGYLAATESSPGLVRLLDSTMPATFRDGTDIIAGETAGSPRVLTPRDAATLWLATLATFLVSAACIPLIANLLRAAGHSEKWALRWSALWMLTPAVAVFLPKDDLLLPFPALLAGVLWVQALERASWWRAAAAGAVCFAGLLLSLAFLPVMAWLVLATAIAWWKDGRSSPGQAPAPSTVRPRARALAAGLAGFLIPTIAAMFLLRMNLPTIWRLNFENHAEFYAHNARTYGAWIVANLGEVILAAGPAVVVLTFVTVLGRRSRTVGTTRWSHLGASGLAIIALLWLSGKNMGEAARLWIPFLPWFLLCLPAPTRDVLPLTPDRRWSPATLLWTAALLLQAVACIAATTSIDGFGFSELP